jgi:hypothetical protein
VREWNGVEGGGAEGGEWNRACEETNVNIFYKQVEKPKAFKCGTFGASSLCDRYFATGDFEGKLNIW